MRTCIESGPVSSSLKILMKARKPVSVLLSVAALLPFLFGNYAFPQAQSKETRWVESTLKRLSLRKKIGQMINVRMSGEFANLSSDKFGEYKRELQEIGIGGFTVYRGEANAIASLTNELQKLSDIPLLFAADYERGLRMQLRTGTPFTTNMALGATGDPTAAFQQGRVICSEMRSIGVNWLFAPVVDINNNPDNPVINIRSFGEDPKAVGDFGVALSQGVRASNCLATLKHFPGHGDTATDSHIGLSVVPIDRQRLDSLELVPFKMAVGFVDAVMTAHVALPRITNDEIPATLNPKISTDILRNEMKFDGIITTDAMDMGAINRNFTPDKAVVMAVQAGADVILLPLDSKAAVDAVERAVRDGVIAESRIDASVRRILRAKFRLGLSVNRYVDLKQVNTAVENPQNVALANDVADKSMTLLRNDRDMLPLTTERARRTIFITVSADDDAMQGITFAPEVERRVPGAKQVRLDPRSTLNDYKRVTEEASKFDSVVLAVFVKRAANKGTVALPEIQAEFVRQLVISGRQVAVIAFGSPYLIRQFPEAKVYFVTYAVEDVAQAAATRVMFGERRFNGKLPVTIPGIFERGAGINR